MNRQEELEGLSDRAINRLVAGSDYYWDSYDSDSEIVIDEGMAWVDYCNNPNDIMPIAIENGIGIKVFSRKDRKPKRWFACDADYEQHAYHVNPYRAICIVFILMKEAENEVAS